MHFIKAQCIVYSVAVQSSCCVSNASIRILFINNMSCHVPSFLPYLVLLFSSYERIAAAITISEDLQLGHTRPDLPLPAVLKNVRFVYYNPVDCSLKVSICVNVVVFIAGVRHAVGFSCSLPLMAFRMSASIVYVIFCHQ